MGYQHFLAASVAVILTACGSSSNNSAEAPAGTKTSIIITNPGSTYYAQAQLVTDDGGVPYDKAINCGNETCYAYLPTDVTQASVLYLKDSSGNIISVFRFPSALNAYNTAYPSDLSTGAYIMHRLAEHDMAKDGLSWDEINLRIATFFSKVESPDGSIDHYEELARYYAKQLKANGLSNQAFMDELRQRLLKWDIASPSEVIIASNTSVIGRAYAWAKNLFNSKHSVVNPAYAQAVSPNCAPGMFEYLQLTKNLGAKFPVEGEAVSGTQALADTYCSSQFESKSNNLLAQLDTVQASVDDIGSRQGKFTEFLDSMNQVTAQFQELRTKAQTYNSQYQSFLRANNVASLDAYFKSKGGWNAGIAAGGKALTDILYSPYNPNGFGMLQWINWATVDPTYKMYLTSITAKCGAMQQNSPANFLMTRQMCNNILLSDAAFLVGVQGGSLPFIQDVYAVLNQYQATVQSNGKTVAQDYPFPQGWVTSYATAYTDIKNTFRDQQARMLADITAKVIGNDGYYNTFDALNPQLLASMVEVDCAQVGTDRSGAPAITGIYATTNRTDENYIVTQCNGSVWNGKNNYVDGRIKARYFYNLDARLSPDRRSSVKTKDVNAVGNVLGVLVQRQLVTEGWQSFFGYLDTANTYKAYGAEDTDATFYSLYAPQVVSYAFLGRGAASKPFGANVVKYSASGCPLGVGSPADCQWKFTGAPDFYTTTWDETYIGSQNSGFSFVVFKDKQGFHYPILLSLSYTGPGLWIRNQYQLQSLCVTLDCMTNNDNLYMNEFKFGPKNVNFMDNTNVPQGGNGRVLRFDEN